MKSLKQLVELLRNKRFLLTILLTFIVAGYFWTQSRYPQLDQKALLGAETDIKQPGLMTLVFILGGIPLFRTFLNPNHYRLNAPLDATLKNQIDVPVCHDWADCEDANPNETFMPLNLL